jgi:acetyl esterase/lipase
MKNKTALSTRIPKRAVADNGRDTALRCPRPRKAGGINAARVHAPPHSFRPLPLRSATGTAPRAIPTPFRNSGFILTLALFAIALPALRVCAEIAPPKPPVATAAAERKPDVTPVSLPGSEAFVFRTVGTNQLRLFVVKPEGWAPSDRRPGFVSFFGGGWVSGSPASSIRWANWAATRGLVGIAPDYRTRSRFNGTPEDCVSDARAAVRWVEEHANELGIDPKKIIAQGGSAGGHVAAWTAISSDGPGKNDPAPKILPAALVLLNPVTDTKDSGYGGSKRFGNDSARALACSVPDQMPRQMPPTLVFHATGDTTVPYSNSVAFQEKMKSSGNRCELVTFEGLGHSYNSSKFGDAGKAADKKTREEAILFLVSLGLMEKEAQ